MFVLPWHSWWPPSVPSGPWRSPSLWLGCLSSPSRYCLAQCLSLGCGGYSHQERALLVSWGYNQQDWGWDWPVETGVSQVTEASASLWEQSHFSTIFDHLLPDMPLGRAWGGSWLVSVYSGSQRVRVRPGGNSEDWDWADTSPEEKELHKENTARCCTCNIQDGGGHIQDTQVSCGCGQVLGWLYMRNGQSHLQFPAVKYGRTGSIFELLCIISVKHHLDQSRLQLCTCPVLIYLLCCVITHIAGVPGVWGLYWGLTWGEGTSGYPGVCGLGVPVYPCGEGDGSSS